MENQDGQGVNNRRCYKNIPFYRMALPTPLRGGVAKGRGGVYIFIVDCMLQTPPLPLPLKGGEWLRLVFLLKFSYSDLLKWTQYFS